VVERQSAEVLSTQLTDDGPVYRPLSVRRFRAHLIARSKNDMPWRNFPSPELMKKFPREVPLFLEMAEFAVNTVYDGWKEASMPKTSSIRSAVSIEHRLVTDRQTDRQTDGHRAMASTRASTALRG